MDGKEASTALAFHQSVGTDTYYVSTLERKMDGITIAKDVVGVPKPGLFRHPIRVHKVINYNSNNLPL